MIPTPHIRIDSKQIAFDLTEKAIAKEFANQVAYDPKRLSLLGYGKTESELRTRLGADWLTMQDRTAWTRIFDPAATGPIFDYEVLDALFRDFRKITHPKNTRKPIQFFQEPLDVRMDIQDYDRLSLGRRRELEYFLFDYQRVQRLWINDREVTISLTWRGAQSIAGQLLRILLPVSILFGGFLSVFTRQGQEPDQFLGTALAWLAGAIVAYFIGTTLWMLTFRKCLPHGYLRYQLRSSGSLLRRPTRWLADKLL